MTAIDASRVPASILPIDLLVVDPGVSEASHLVDGRRSGMEVLHLAPGGRGLEQIAAHLAGRGGIASLHLLSHGEPGALRLAGERIDLPAMAMRRGVLSDIAAALAGDAEVLLYGCSVAAGPRGRGFLAYIEAALGADVSASVSPVGAAALGGGWTLRGRDGAAADPAFTAASRLAFPELLVVLTGTAGNDTLSGTSGSDTISALDGDDLVYGDAGNDTLYGGGGVDTLSGGAGNDFLYGATGNDLLYGGDGNDAVSGGDGDDTLYGEAGNDTVIGSSGADLLYGGDGNDWMWGGRGDDLLYGGNGTDTMSGGDGVDTLYGEADNDTLSGFSGDDILFGGDGNDALRGGSDNDTLSGGAGADSLSGGSGFDTLIGGAGNDLFTGSVSDFNSDTISDFAVGDSIVVTGADLSSLNGTTASSNLATGNNGITLTGISSASGTFSAVYGGADTTITLVAPVVASGGGSSDNTLVVNDQTSTDTTGAARVISNSGSTPGSAAIVQNTGNNGNVVTATLPGAVSITSEGPSTAQSGTTAETTLVTAIQSRGSGGQTALVSNAQTFLTKLGSTTTLDIRTIVPTQTSGVTTDDPIVITGTTNTGQSEAFVIDMRSVTGKELQVNNIEFVSIIGNAKVTGGAGNNYAVGDDSNQFISLGEGDDTLYGGDGNDTVGSASGNDELYGDGGSDTVNGGTGNDTVYGGTDADVVYGNQGNDTLFGGQGDDTVAGGQDSDVIYGNLGDDLVFGNLGDDSVFGGSGNDRLFGGQGNDTLVGGIGNDTLYGGKGDDLISGGTGNDLIVIADSGGADTVSDFDGESGDRIQIATNTNGTSIDTFAELEAAAANDADGNVVITLDGGNSLTLMGVSTAQLQSGWFSFV